MGTPVDNVLAQNQQDDLVDTPATSVDNSFNEHLAAYDRAAQSILSVDDAARAWDANSEAGSMQRRDNPFTFGSIARRDAFDLSDPNSWISGNMPEHTTGADTLGRTIPGRDEDIAQAANKDVINNPLLSGQTVFPTADKTAPLVFPTLNRTPRVDTRYNNFPQAPRPPVNPLRKQIISTKYPQVPVKT